MTGVTLGTGRRVEGPRDGFTLIELLVVLGIIGLLALLLAPAVLFSRREALRAYCGSQTSQVAKGFAGHQTALGCFPFNGDVRWGIVVLPYIEQGPLYNGYNVNIEPWSDENRTVVVTAVGVFLCPSRPRTVHHAGLALTDFEVNSQAIGRRDAEITDGSTHTTVGAEMAWTDPERVGAYGLGPQIVVLDPIGFHDGGKWIGMCDGSVRFLRLSSSTATWDALITRSGGELQTEEY